MLRVEKKTVPRILSDDSSTKAATRVGKAKSIATTVKSMNQVNIGIFMRLIPFVLSQSIETIMFTLPKVTETASRTRPR